MEDIDLGNLPTFDIPEVPISHDIPRTTLDSLVQIKNEFSQKLEEANAKNDSSKKRRYQRQLKQFEDAIKATKDGKAYNYSDLVVPPGFAQIPLQSDGRPILSISQPSRSSVVPNKPAPRISKNEENYDNIPDEAGDDLLEQLNREIDENDDDDLGCDNLDLEDDDINRKLNSLLPNIKKILPKDHLDDELEKKLAAFRPPDFDDIKPLRQSSNREPANIQHPPVTAVSETKKKSPQKRPHASKELNILEERQRLFKEAALQAKKEGNTNVALVYLRNAKGFDSMIIAAENGLPLDMKNLPIPPQLQSKISPSKQNTTQTQLKVEKTQSVVLDEEPLTGDRNAIYQRLIDDLREQVKIATNNFKHFTQMGDVNNANKFNKIAKESIKDLDALKTAFSRGHDVPLYHYEKRSYQTIDCNSDLTDNDLDLTIIRAVNLPLPKDFDEKHMTTYVKFEFPYPPEALQTDKTSKISGTLNPEFNQNFKVQIQRKQSKFCRLMNRKDLKFEIYYKAGFLKGDKLLATSLVKLQQLENSATIHDAFDLLEGRRQLGGKLEVKIRIREPLAHKKVQDLELRWLIIDKFIIENKDSIAL